MDSKWKRTAICVSACMCLLLLLLVLFTNLPQRKGTADVGGAVTSAGTQTDQDTGAGQQGADKSNLSAFCRMSISLTGTQRRPTDYMMKRTGFP